MLQYSQAVGFPYALTFASHFLQIEEVLDLLKIIKKNLEKDKFLINLFSIFSLRSHLIRALKL